MLVSGPEVSRLEASLADVLFDGIESIDELLEDERDSEQLAELEDWIDDCVEIFSEVRKDESSKMVSLSLSASSSLIPSDFKNGFTVAEGLGAFSMGLTAQDGFTFPVYDFLSSSEKLNFTSIQISGLRMGI